MKLMKAEAHHEDAEHHVVVVDEEDELVSSGGKLCRHLQHKVFHLHLEKYSNIHVDKK